MLTENDATTAAERRVFRPTLHHVFLKTTRLPEMKAWYVAVLGMEVVRDLGGAVFLSNDEANHRLVLLKVPHEDPVPEKYSRAGLYHMAFEFPSHVELLATYRRLKLQDVRPHMTVMHGQRSTSFYYADPDSNSVELQVDNFADWARSKESLRFSDDPFLVPVDAELLLADVEAGASLDEIRERGVQGVYVSPAAPVDPRLGGHNEEAGLTVGTN